MPLQNRVSPFGEIVADPSRGMFMGNRGILHDEERRLGIPRWRHPDWVTCCLSFGSRRRTLMAPGSYTELFFLDEATALAAGHRPCAECRRTDYNRYVTNWTTGHRLPVQPSAKTMDAELHRARVTRGREHVTFESQVADLPNGTLISIDGRAWLIWDRKRLLWSFDGYSDPRDLPATAVAVLTPMPTVVVLSAGYLPVVHLSVDLIRN